MEESHGRNMKSIILGMFGLFVFLQLTVVLLDVTGVLSFNKLLSFIPFLPKSKIEKTVTRSQINTGAITQTGGATFSIAKQDIKKGGSPFDAPVDTGNGIALFTIQGIVGELTERKDSKLLVLVKPDGTPVSEMVEMNATTPVVIVDFSKKPPTEKEGSYLDVQKGDQLMVSYNIDTKTKKITIGGIRVSRNL